MYYLVLACAQEGAAFEQVTWGIGELTDEEWRVLSDEFYADGWPFVAGARLTRFSPHYHPEGFKGTQEEAAHVADGLAQTPFGEIQEACRQWRQSRGR